MIEGDFGRAPGVYSRSKGESVGLPKLIGERSFFGRNEFVACAENGDSGEEGNFEFSGSDRRGHAEMSWPDFGAGGKDAGAGGCVGSLAVDEDSFGGFAIDGGGVFVDFDFFVRNDGVAVWRERGARHDLPAMTWLQGVWIGRACGMEALKLEGHSGVAGMSESNAVHGDAVEGWERAVGVEVFAEDTAQGISERNGFRFQKKGMIENELLGF